MGRETGFRWLDYTSSVVSAMYAYVFAPSGNVLPADSQKHPGPASLIPIAPRLSLLNPQQLRYFENAEAASTQSSSDVCVSCSRSAGDGNTFPVSLVELGPTTVKFLTSEPIAFQDSVRLRFTSKSCGLDAELQADVRWHRRKGTQWLIGAHPSKGVPESMLQSLAIAGAVERRDSDRCDVSIAVQVREAGQTERKAATIVEFSEGGVRLKLASDSLEVGQPLKLFLDLNGRESAFQLQTCWVGKGASRLAGFAIVDSQAEAFRVGLAQYTGNQVAGTKGNGLNRWLRKAKSCVTDRPTLRS